MGRCRRATRLGETRDPFLSQNQRLRIADVELIVGVAELAEQQLRKQLIDLGVCQAQNATAGGDRRGTLLKRGAVSWRDAAERFVERTKDSGAVLNGAGQRLITRGD